jgi:hypothetical protein
VRQPVESLGKTPRGFYRLILHQCAFSFIRRSSWEFLDLFGLYRDFKQFPFPGSILEQPARMIDAFRIFQVELDALRGPERPLTAAELVEILGAAFGKKR